MTDTETREVEEVIYIFAKAIHDAAVQQRVDVLESINQYATDLSEIDSDEITMLPEAWADIAESASITLGSLDDEDEGEILSAVEIAASAAEIGTMPMVMYHAFRDFDGLEFPGAVSTAIDIMEGESE
jgi:hypothetical protein